MSEIQNWLSGRLPDAWFREEPTVTVDREEIIVVGTLPSGADDHEAFEARDEGRIARFREETREARMQIADEAEERYGRKVAWGATSGEVTALFTHLAVPVMTRLRQPERKVLDTLVASGVARSRSDALAWCVRLVGRNEQEWIDRLQEALKSVERARAEGPAA
ncbi:hypothetical protein CGZ93_01890 [Enemella dayhoffiae]|uniref:Uncharacterized protein n=1 Tax=Enemella dayhoffiae TaxID=2016507 RepID=A0A255HC17_9ACTN|nr:hypothetical protein [Enemella dayhoffiae]OYO25225.1 hypothetical protein CGZ93_01890 [Enemella dayhoffiae]